MSCGNFSGTFTTPDTNATPEEIICRGSSPSYQGTNWFNFWSQNAGFFCESVFKNILFSGNTISGIRQYNPNEIQRVKDNMSNVFAQYQLSNTLSDVNNIDFNACQETSFRTCEGIPGACSDFQNIYCSSCSRETIASTRLLTRLCGCKAPALPAQFNVNDPACDPLCNRSNAILNINEITGAVKICTSDVCVIDNINITATNNSTIENGVTFSQLCGGCKQSCRCIIAGVNINDVLIQSGLTNNVQFSSSCANASCFIDDGNGGLTASVCPTGAVFTEPSVPIAVNNTTIIFIVVVLLIIIFAIFALRF